MYIQIVFVILTDLWISSEAALRITDSGAESAGKISGGSSEQGGAFFNEGTLLIEAGTICHNSSSGSEPQEGADELPIRGDR